MNLVIRNIVPADIAIVISLVHEFAAFESLTDYCEVTKERLYAAMFGSQAMVEGLIAVDDETPIGYALFYPNFSSFRGQRGLYLEDIYLNSVYRGRGIGETMLREIALVAVSRGFERIDLMVDDGNAAAIKFYKRLGAVRDGDERHFKFRDEAFAQLRSEPPA